MFERRQPASAWTGKGLCPGRGGERSFGAHGLGLRRPHWLPWGGPASPAVSFGRHRAPAVPARASQPVSWSVPGTRTAPAGAWHRHSLTPVLLRVQSPWRGTNRPRNIWATQAGMAPPRSRAQAQARWCVGWGWGLGSSGAHLAPRGEQSWHRAGQLPLSAWHPPWHCFLLQPCRQTTNPSAPMGKLRLREARSLGQSETSKKWWTGLHLEACVLSFCHTTLSSA